ncbi:MAG: glucuronate isomerase, partial [Bacteroidota bacterium]
NHLPPSDIALGRNFKSITQAWLEGDHYKWRAMRAYGISEKYITGEASDEEKFMKWAEVVPYTIRNPLFHWNHLELRRYFNIADLLNQESALAIYENCNHQLSNTAFNCQGLLRKMKVESLCTTDDPLDTLEHHQSIAKDRNFDLQVFPTFRPDKLYSIDSVGYASYLVELSEAVGFEIFSLETLLEAIRLRITFFSDHGCKLSDHGLECLYDVAPSLTESNRILRSYLFGKMPDAHETQVFKMTILIELTKLYSQMGWTQQFHLGAIRNNNTLKLRELGPDTGYDSIGDYNQIQGLSLFLGRLEQAGHLPKTILYNLNPKDNAAFATMAGNFMDGITPGKIQFGSGWWFLDQKDGMEHQLNTLSNMGLLSKFVGMLTDSRSFLSFPRHEYFRRVLCNLIGRDVENGELPADEKLLGSIVQDICYYNAKRYLQLDN